MNESKFDGKGAVYARYRPKYSSEFIKYLYTDVGMTGDSVIADVGAGTGILSGQLLCAGSTVYAVEPNADMRCIAEHDLSVFEHFISVNGTAENTTIVGGSVDFVTAAQAFHWFDRAAFKTECARILKPGGKVILVWNSRDEASELVMDNESANRRYCPSFKGFSGGLSGGVSTGEFSDFFEGEYASRVFNNDIPLDLGGFIGRNLSSSYAPKMQDANYEAYIEALEEIFAKHSREGLVVMPNTTLCYIGKV